MIILNRQSVIMDKHAGICHCLNIRDVHRNPTGYCLLCLKCVIFVNRVRRQNVKCIRKLYSWMIFKLFTLEICIKGIKCFDSNANVF